MVFGRLARRWRKTGRPVLIAFDPPRGFFLNQRPLKAGQRYFTGNRIATTTKRFVYGSAIFVPWFLMSYYYYPNYDLREWGKYRAHEELMKEDEEWAEIGKEYGFDKLPRNLWQNDLGVRPWLRGVDNPWPGMEFPPAAGIIPPKLIKPPEYYER